MKKVKKPQRSPKPSMPFDLLVMIACVVLVLLIPVGIAVQITTDPQDRPGATMTFAFCILTDLLILYAGYLGYTMAKEKYRTNAAVLIVIGIASFLADILDFMFFDMKLQDMLYDTPIGYVVGLVLAVPFVINTYFLMRSLRFPKYDLLRRWSWFGLLWSAGFFLLYIIFEIGALLQFGQDVISNPHTYLDEPLIVIAVCCFLAFVALLVCSIVGLIWSVIAARKKK